MKNREEELKMKLGIRWVSNRVIISIWWLEETQTKDEKHIERKCWIHWDNYHSVRCASFRWCRPYRWRERVPPSRRTESGDCRRSRCDALPAAALWVMGAPSRWAFVLYRLLALGPVGGRRFHRRWSTLSMSKGCPFDLPVTVNSTTNRCAVFYVYLELIII